jgi:hypothetical protein
MSDVVGIVAMAVGAALYRDLPDIQDTRIDYVKFNSFTKVEQSELRKNSMIPVVEFSRRPVQSELKVFVFPQTWPSTALGYPGIGGSAMTFAYTIVVQCFNTICVYFGSDRLAYRIELDKISSRGRENYFTDIQFHNMASVDKSMMRYQ